MSLSLTMRVSSTPAAYPLNPVYFTAVKESSNPASSGTTRPVKPAQVPDVRGKSDSKYKAANMEAGIADQDQGIVPAFSRPDPPSLVALDGYKMNLQWEAVQQLTPDPAEYSAIQLCKLEYLVETHMVSSSP